MSFRYNLIPKRLLSGKDILEIGAGNGESQRKCHYREIFLSANYIGIDLLYSSTSPFIEKVGFLQKDFHGRHFDTILMIEVLEHFPFGEWSQVFNKIASLMNNGGVFFFTTPYKEKAHISRQPSIHQTFGIVETTIQEFFPQAYMKRRRDPCYPLFYYEKGKIWGVFRGIKRIITRHEYLSKRILITEVSLHYW